MGLFSTAYFATTEHLPAPACDRITDWLALHFNIASESTRPLHISLAREIPDDVFELITAASPAGPDELIFYSLTLPDYAWLPDYQRGPITLHCNLVDVLEEILAGPAYWAYSVECYGAVPFDAHTRSIFRSLYAATLADRLTGRTGLYRNDDYPSDWEVTRFNVGAAPEGLDEFFEDRDAAMHTAQLLNARARAEGDTALYAPRDLVICHWAVLVSYRDNADPQLTGPNFRSRLQAEEAARRYRDSLCEGDEAIDAMAVVVA